MLFWERQATLCGVAFAFWERNVPTWQVRCLARWVGKKLVPETIV